MPVAQIETAAQSNPVGAELNRVCIAFTCTAALFVAFRIGIRTNRKVLGADDLWIVIALAFSVVLTATVVVSVKCGYGMHEPQLSKDAVAKALFWWYLAQVFYKCITWPTKISILLMYRRVFGATGDMRAYGIPFRTIVYGAMAVVAACFISLETAGVFACYPVRRSWDTSVPGTCLSRSGRYYAYVACNFATDLICLAIPIPLINGLNIPKRQKWSLMAVFFLGGFVCVATLIRVDKLNIGSDVTYNGVPSVMWSCVEANVGIICACLPLMRPLINWVLPWFSRRSASPGYTYDSGYHTRNTYTKQSHRGTGDRENIDLGDKGDAVIMSSVIARDRYAESRTSSEVAITGGIHRKIEVETHTEPAELDGDKDSDKDSRESSERYGCHAV